jgi:hypothetical protein
MNKAIVSTKESALASFISDNLSEDVKNQVNVDSVRCATFICHCNGMIDEAFFIIEDAGRPCRLETVIEYNNSILIELIRVIAIEAYDKIDKSVLDDYTYVIIYIKKDITEMWYRTSRTYRQISKIPTTEIYEKYQLLMDAIKCATVAGCEDVINAKQAEGLMEFELINEFFKYANIK